MSPSPTKRMLLVALVVLFSDQITKILILTFLGYGHEWSVVDAVSYTHLTLPTIYSV